LENNLDRNNSAAVIAVAKHLELSTDKFHWSSEIGVDEQHSEMLISLTRAVGADAYMCGGGAEGYQEDALFAVAGIELVYQDFKHPAYNQYSVTDSVPGSSIIDAFMNCGLSNGRVCQA